MLNNLENILKGKKEKSKWRCNHCNALLTFFFEGNLCEECFKKHEKDIL